MTKVSTLSSLSHGRSSVSGPAGLLPVREFFQEFVILTPPGVCIIVIKINDRGSSTTPLMPGVVILSPSASPKPVEGINSVKNPMNSGSYTFEILRLTPQNDVVGQPP